MQNDLENKFCNAKLQKLDANALHLLCKNFPYNKYINTLYKYRVGQNKVLQYFNE